MSRSPRGPHLCLVTRFLALAVHVLLFPTRLGLIQREAVANLLVGLMFPMVKDGRFGGPGPPSPPWHPPCLVTLVNPRAGK